MPRCFQYICVILLLCPALAGCGGGSPPEFTEETIDFDVQFSPTVSSAGEGRVILRAGTQLRCYDEQWNPLWTHGEMVSFDGRRPFIVAGETVVTPISVGSISGLDLNGNINWNVDPVVAHEGSSLGFQLLMQPDSAGESFLAVHILHEDGSVRYDSIVSNVSLDGTINWQTVIEDRQITGLTPAADGSVIASYHSASPALIDSQGNVYELTAADEKLRVVDSLPLTSLQTAIASGSGELLLLSRDRQIIQGEIPSSPGLSHSVQQLDSLVPVGEGFAALNANHEAVSMYDNDLVLQWSWDGTGSTGLSHAGICVDNAGNVYCVEYDYLWFDPMSGEARLVSLDPEGVLRWTSELPEALTSGGSGLHFSLNPVDDRIVVSERLNVWIYDSAGERVSHKAADEKFSIVVERPIEDE